MEPTVESIRRIVEAEGFQLHQHLGGWAIMDKEVLLAWRKDFDGLSAMFVTSEEVERAAKRYARELRTLVF